LVLICFFNYSCIILSFFSSGLCGGERRGEKRLFMLFTFCNLLDTKQNNDYNNAVFQERACDDVDDVDDGKSCGREHFLIFPFLCVGRNERDGENER